MRSELGNPSTASELLFEEYLTAHGYMGWTHEKPMEGKPTTPDYRLLFGGAGSTSVQSFSESKQNCRSAAARDYERPVPLHLGHFISHFPWHRGHFCGITASVISVPDPLHLLHVTMPLPSQRGHCIEVPYAGDCTVAGDLVASG